MKFAPVALALLLFTLTASAQVSQSPTFAALDIKGNRVDINALRGKIVVLNLWFVNCPNCVEEIKLLNQLVDDYKTRNDVVFLGLAASPKPALDKFLVKNPFKYTIIPNSQMIILSKFGTPDKTGQINVPFPMHFVLDRDGKIVMKEQGIKGVDVVRKTLKEQLK